MMALQIHSCRSFVAKAVLAVVEVGVGTYVADIEREVVASKIDAA